MFRLKSTFMRFGVVPIALVVGSLGMIEKASAQTFTGSFGPLIEQLNGAQSEETTITVATTIDPGSNATLNLTVNGDLNATVTERLRVFVDGVDLGVLATTEQCLDDETFALTIPDTTLAPLIADGQLTIRFESEFGVNNFCNNGSINTTGVFAPPVPTFSFAVQGSISYTSGPVGPTESDNLKTQQLSMSNLVVNFQMNNVANGVFDHLGQSFANGGNGVLVNAAGFSASVSGIANQASQFKQRKINRQVADLSNYGGDDKTGARFGGKTVVTPAATHLPAKQFPWNAWIKGDWNYYDGEGSSFDGQTIDVMVGIDYRYNKNTVIGILAGYGNSDFDLVTSGTAGAFKADGYSTGPYIGLKLSEYLQFNAFATYTFSDYVNSSGATTGTFDAHRVTAAAELKGTWNVNDFFINPGIRIVYAEEHQNAYTDSAAVRQSSLVVKAGRVSVGPKIGYIYRSEDGNTIKPWLALKGEYDFSNQDSAATSGLVDLSNVVSARVGVGLDVATSKGLSLSLQGNVSGLGSNQYTGYGGTARVNAPF